MIVLSLVNVYEPPHLHLPFFILNVVSKQYKSELSNNVIIQEISLGQSKEKQWLAKPLILHKMLLRTPHAHARSLETPYLQVIDVIRNAENQLTIGTVEERIG